MESQLFQPLGEDIFGCHSACLKYESDHSRKKLSDVAMYFSAPTCLVGNAAYAKTTHNELNKHNTTSPNTSKSNIKIYLSSYFCKLFRSLEFTIGKSIRNILGAVDKVRAREF